MRTLSIETPDVADGYTRYYLDIKTDLTPDLIRAICDTYDYQAKIPDMSSREAQRERRMISNPVTPEDFLRAHVVGHLTQVLLDWRKQEAMRQVVPASVDAGAFQ